MAYLRGRDGGFCGGFLVAPGWVMTAAQCFSPLTVILGARDIQREEESWQELQVQKSHCHPKYSRREEGHDILLLEVPRAVAVELGGGSPGHATLKGKTPISARLSGGVVCSVAGWGHGASNAALCEANVTLSKERDCLAIYPAPSPRLFFAVPNSSPSYRAISGVPSCATTEPTGSTPTPTGSACPSTRTSLPTCPGSTAL
uniref:Peptidase S1 domain-containing protein n=1 Tax=Pavo cristatus TaxID=9049 RepID=A0A8C9LDY1_PAVCR